MTLVQNEPKKIYKGSTEIKAVYLGTTKVRPSGWRPGANTLLYCPFTADLDNHSLQTYAKVSSVNTSITTVNNLKCAYFTDGYISFPDTSILNGVYTICVWRKLTQASGATPFVFVGKGTGASNRYYAYWEGSNTYRISSSYWGNDLTVSPTAPSYPSAWELFTTTVDSSNIGKLYKGTSMLGSGNFGTSRNVSSGYLYVGADATAVNTSGARFTGYLSNMIIEDKCWSADEITAYYNQTKSNYGL